MFQKKIGLTTKETIINLNRPLSKQSKDHAETKITTRINPAIAVKKANKCISCH